jgi:hypothetical protein
VKKNNTDIIRYENGKCVVAATEDNIGIIKENILKNIKLDNLSSFISEINRSGIYQFVHIPKGGHLQQYGKEVGGVFYDANGKILKHGRLKEMGVNVGNICKIAANQAMFAYIIIQLNEINQKLDLILEGQHNDRIAKIDGAIRAYEHLDRENSNIENIILQIETGIAELEKELNQLSKKLNPKAKFGDNWLFSDKGKEIERTHNQFVEAIGWIFKGYETLLKINVKRGKFTGAEHLISFLETGRLKELAELARGLPYKKSEFGYPEERWEKINVEKPTMVKNLRTMIDFEKKAIDQYAIEFKGEDLLEALK